MTSILNFFVYIRVLERLILIVNIKGFRPVCECDVPIVMLMELQALLFILALIVRAANRPAEYDSDEEFINPRQPARQPLLNNRPAGPAPGAPVTGTLDQRPGRNDAWSARMREKVQSFVSAMHFIYYSCVGKFSFACLNLAVQI